MTTGQNNCLFGLSAEFEQPEDLLDAARRAREAGYTRIKAYSPYEVHGMSEVLEHKSPLAPWILFIGLFIGALAAFGLQYWTSVEDYALNVGGRPYFSWPAFIPITFEVAILVAGLLLVGWLFLRTGLPLPYHPIFNVPDIAAASRNRFFLCIESRDGQFHTRETWQFLESLEPVKVSEVTC